MTSLGFPGSRKGPKNQEMDWDDKPEAQACHRSPFRGFLAEKDQQNPKRTGAATGTATALASTAAATATATP